MINFINHCFLFGCILTSYKPRQISTAFYYPAYKQIPICRQKSYLIRPKFIIRQRFFVWILIFRSMIYHMMRLKNVTLENFGENRTIQP